MMFLKYALKGTPLGLKIANITTYTIVFLTDAISVNVDLLNPDTAKAISFYFAVLLSGVTMVIAIRKELREGKKFREDRDAKEK